MTHSTGHTAIALFAALALIGVFCAAIVITTAATENDQFLGADPTDPEEDGESIWMGWAEDHLALILGLALIIVGSILMFVAWPAGVILMVAGLIFVGQDYFDFWASIKEWLGIGAANEMPAP